MGRATGAWPGRREILLKRGLLSGQVRPESFEVLILHITNYRLLSINNLLMVISHAHKICFEL